MNPIVPSGSADVLAGADDRFDLLAASLPIGIFYCDAFGFCLYANEPFCALSGRSLADCLGEGWQALIPGGDRLRLFEQWQTAPTQGHMSELVVDDADHKPARHLLLRVRPMRDRRGVQVGYAGTLEDISEQQQQVAALIAARDQAMRVGEARLSFLAQMSHEIRTPVSGIVGMTGLLLDTSLTSQQRDYAETIRSSGDTLVSVLNDILDLSKIESGKLELEAIEFDLRELVEGTIELLAVRAQAKRIELGYLLPENVPTRVQGDPTRLRQILTNLVGNAIKFTEKGEVFVRVTPASTDPSGLELKFEVRDSGIGIPAEAVPSLFQPFGQADASTTRRFGGTGLGLAISRQLAERMGGSIGVQSRPGEGSTFWFTVKLGASGQKQAGAAASRKRLAGIRALIVDDNATSREIVQHQLQAWQMDCTVVSNGHAAMQCLRQAHGEGRPFQLVLLDYLMPEMDGLAVARAIKRDGTCGPVRLALLTALGQPLDQAVLEEAGIEQYLIKPVRRARLEQALVKMLDEGATASTRTGSSHAEFSPSLLPKPDAGTPRILVAEDSLVNRKVALGQLKKLGHTARVVSNGREVLEALRASPYDIILMDGQMPEMDGYEATRAVRELEQRGEIGLPQPIRIIAMTASVMEGDRERCLAAGMDDYISKPVRCETLKAALDQWRPAVARPADEKGMVVNKNIETPFAEPPQPAIDFDRLNEVCGGDPTEVRDLVMFYLSQAEELVQSLAAAVESNLPEDVQQIAHKLAGSSATCGMAAIVGPLRKLETQGKSGALSSPDLLLRQVKFELQRIQDTVDAGLPGGPAADSHRRAA